MNFYKNFTIYFTTEFVNKMIPFLLMPILTKYLAPAEFGVYGMYQVVLSLFAPFVAMSLQTNITRNFFKLEKERMSEIIRSLVLILHINVFLALVIVSIVTFVFHNPFGIPNHILFLMPIVLYGQTINTFNLTIYRNSEKAHVYGALQISLTVLNYAVALFLLINIGEGWLSLVYGVVFSHLIVSLFSIYTLFKKYTFQWKFYPLGEIYAVSVPLIFHVLGGSIIFLSDRIFIERMLGLSEVGLYTVGIQFGMMTMIVINIVFTTISPWIYKNLANNNQGIVIKIYQLMIGFILLGVVIGLSASFVFPYMVDSRYSAASSVILWASMTYAVRGWYQFYHAIIVHEGRTRVFMYISFGVAMMNLILNYLFISVNGMVGAIQATFLSFIIMFIATYYFASKYSKLNFYKIGTK